MIRSTHDVRGEQEVKNTAQTPSPTVLTLCTVSVTLPRVMDLLCIYTLYVTRMAFTPNSTPKLQLDSAADIDFDQIRGPRSGRENRDDKFSFQNVQHLFTRVSAGSHTIKLKLDTPGGTELGLARLQVKGIV